MDPNRAAEITNMHTAPFKTGSGYLVKDNWILTARHILTPRGKDSVALGSKYSFRLIGDFEKEKSTNGIIQLRCVGNRLSSI